MEGMRKIRQIVRFTLITLAVGSVLALAGLALAPEAWAAEPCCGIVSIDARTGLVTAREITKPAEPVGRTFQFEVKDKTLLKGLKVGQAVYADFTGMKVSLKPASETPCCNIVGAAAAGAVR